MSRLRHLLDIDQLLIFALLAVTVNQLGYYLAQFAPDGLWWIGYLQAIGIDLTIWRSAHWYRLYTGKKQRTIALSGLLFFTLVSIVLNAAYYHTVSDLPVVQATLMGATLPVSVAFVSYLYGVKETSKFATSRSNDAQSESKPAPKAAEPKGGELVCHICQPERVFAWPSDYSDQRAAQNAMNAHRCRQNGHDKEPEYLPYQINKAMSDRGID